MTTVLNGLLGGAVAGLVAALATELVDGNPSPATVVLAAVRADESTPSRWLGVVGLTVYGSAAGGLLLVLELLVFGVLGVPPSIGEALAVAVVWSAALLVVALGAQRVVLERPADGSTVALAAFHLVYGVGLGLWIRLTWIT